MKKSPEETAQKIVADKFSDAEVVFLAGSVMRGEGTEFSDLDMVVVYKKLDYGYRFSFIYDEWPVEALVHDEETLAYFFEDDRSQACPALAQMITESKVFPADNALSAKLKTRAKAIIDAGPPKWTEMDIYRARYTITDLIDDIRAPRNQSEAFGTGAQLYENIANFYFRSQNEWTADGKTLDRLLKKNNPELAKRYEDAFAALYTSCNPSKVIALAEDVLEPHGGFLFDGYHLDAPPEWKIKPEY